MIDTHAHLDFPDYKNDFLSVLDRAVENDIKAIVCVGIDERSSRRVVELAGLYPQIWATVGIHPHDASKVSRGYLKALEELAESPRVLAIGEIGLDYHRDRSPRDIQQKIFREQLKLAQKINKPVIIHCREAYKDLTEILMQEDIERIGGVLHCYSGDESFARQSLDLGLYISIAGPVTYPNAHQLREVVKMLPTERLLIETDAPFLAPQPYRGKRNEPSFIQSTYEKVAGLKNISVKELQVICRENLQRLTGIRIQNSQTMRQRIE